MTEEKYIVTDIHKITSKRDMFYIQPIDNPLGNIKDGHLFNSFEEAHGSFELGDPVSPIYSNGRIIGATKLIYLCRVHARIISADGTVAFCQDYGDVAIKLKEGAPRPARGDYVILGCRDDDHCYEIVENITALELRKEFLLHKAAPYISILPKQL